jgi:hypothetical protein
MPCLNFGWSLLVTCCAPYVYGRLLLVVTVVRRMSSCCVRLACVLFVVGLLVSA